MPTKSELRFEIREMLGRGGMGEVLQAWDRKSGRMVALKSLHAALAHDPTLRARLKREAELASSIQHVNVARVHGLTQQEGTIYLCMEFVEGEPLDRIIKKQGALPTAVALGAFRQLCRGVEAIHTKDIIHRDLKPANVLFSRRDGRAVVVDFGIAKSEGSDDLTRSGALLGSLYYMSPEQVRLQEATRRSDVYSLGIILQELVTGVCPFRKAGKDLQLGLELRSNPPSPRELEPDLPDFIVEAIGVCLSVDPADRFPDATSILAYLDAHSQELEGYEEKGLTVFTEAGEFEIGAPPYVVIALPEGELRNEVVRRVERLGFHSRTVDDGNQALEWSTGKTCRLLVMTADFPGLDGLRACEIMSRFDGWDATKTLVVVDGRQKGSESQARHAGATDVASLPLPPHGLERQLRHLLM